MPRFTLILKILLFLVATALSLKSLREPDLWWMYRTGEWMLEQGSPTFSDPFSYTMQGADWLNVKWLYEILMLFFLKIGGAESLFLLQTAVSLSLLVLLSKTSNLLQKNILEKETQNPPLSWFWVGLASLFLLDFRFIARPEIISQLMTAAYIFLLLKHKKNPSKAIFWLVPLQCLWANLHEAFGIGMVLLVVYLVADWVEFLLRKKWLKEAVEAPKTLSLAVFLALIAVAIHPQTYQMWLHPFNIFGQLQDNKFTSELVSFRDIQYWKWEAYGSLVYAFIVLVFLFVIPRISVRTSGIVRHWLQYWLQHFGLGYLAWVAALWVLSLTAYRNIPFFILISTPLVVLALQMLGNRFLANKPRLNLVGMGLTALLLLGGYVAVVSERFYQWKGSHDRYGLQVLSGHNPIGAAQFIEENGLAEKRCFSDYLTSSYLLWRLQPHFKTYIDLRDLDIFPREFFFEFAEMTQYPPTFQQKDSLYNFEYVVLFRPLFAELHQYLIATNDYEMVFLDPVAAVYIKNKPEHQALIQKYGFEHRGNKDILTALPPSSSSALSYGISKIFNPFYQAEDYDDLDYDLIRSSFYQSVGQLQSALQFAQQSVAKGKEVWFGNEMMGNIYNTWAFMPGQPDSLRPAFIQAAFRAYDAALAQNPKHIPALTGKAILWLQQRDFVKPISFLKKALDVDANHVSANQYMALCYKMMVNSGQTSKFNVEQWIHYTEKLNRLNPENPVILLDLGLAYCQKNDCANARFYLDKVQGAKGLPAEELKTMQRCLGKCK